MLGNTVFIYDSVSFFIPYMEAKGVKCFASFKPINSKFKVLRKLSLTLNIWPSLWYGEWKNKLKDAETLIIFASNRWDFIKYICDNNPKLRVIVWYWNPISRCFNPNKLKANNLEYWSFDMEDCERYNLKHNSTFYFNNIDNVNREHDIDVLFVGADKGRKPFLEKIQKDLNERDITSSFHIVPAKGSHNSDRVKPISYEEYLNRVSRSTALLDYLQEGQNGQTLRPMEAMFFRKKLITNDKTILSLDFYNPRNIFILGVDDLNNLSRFIRGDYHDLDSKISEYFDFTNWLGRFKQKEVGNE